MKISDLKTYTVVAGSQAPQAKTQVPLANKVSNFFGAKGITDQFGASIARTNLPGMPKLNTQEKSLVQNPSFKEVAGSAIQTGANLIPGAGKGLGLAAKTAIGGGTGYAFDVGSKMQSGQGQPLKPGIGTTVGAAIPGTVAVAKPVTRIVGRLLKGLGSGLSGVSTETIDKIVSNPKAAQLATDKLKKSGNAKVLEDNARQVMEGVGTIRKEARKAYGEGLESLKKEDIDPKKFRTAVQGFLDKYKVESKGANRLLDVEFEDPKNVQRASNLIDELSKSDLDGLSLRKLINKIEGTKFKTATSDERLAFNAFTKELAESIKGAVSGSTNKLGEINKAFSSDMQLTEAIEDIFGKVKFKNLSEVVKATKKLESLFAQKGIAPEVIDDFLNRIGVSPDDFKTTEAVRQISNKATGANTKGLTFGELTQQATSAIVTPQMIRDISIKIGLAENKLAPELNKLTPMVRNLIMNALVQSNK